MPHLVALVLRTAFTDRGVRAVVFQVLGLFVVASLWHNPLRWDQILIPPIRLYVRSRSGRSCQREQFRLQA